MCRHSRNRAYKSHGFYFPVRICSIIVLKKGVYSVCRLFILNDDETIKADVSRDVIDYSLSITYQSGQRRTLSITMVNENHKWKPKYNTGLVQIGSKFRLDLGFVMYKTVYWKQMGIFLLKDPSASRERANNTISFQNTYYTIKQDAGNTLGEIFTDLAGTISSDIYYNEYGNMCIESNVNEFISGNLPVVWQFGENDRDILNLSYLEASSNIVNSVLVKGNIVNGYQFSATAKNNNPLSPTCIQYRGELFDVISDEALYSDELCRDRAQYELLAHTRGTSTVNISTPFLPIFDVNQIVMLNMPSEDIKGEQFAVNSISYNTSGLSLTLENINEVIF